MTAQIANKKIRNQTYVEDIHLFAKDLATGAMMALVIIWRILNGVQRILHIKDFWTIPTLMVSTFYHP